MPSAAPPSYAGYYAPPAAAGSSYSMPAGSAPGTDPQLPEREAASWHSLLRSGQLSSKTQMPDIWELIFLPWVVLIIVLMCMTLAHGSLSFMLWLPFVLVVGIAGFFTYVEYRGRRTGEVILGALCVLAACIGFAVGLYAYTTWLREYYRLGAGAHYNNIAPTETAAGYIDATTIVFTDGSRVDGSRAYGYMDSQSKPYDTYCVAPIAANPDASNQVQFWAAGRNCCLQRTNFVCGEAESTSAHGGVALAGPYPQAFKDAVAGAQYAYGLQAARDYMLVSWMEDPTAYKDRLRSRTRTFCLIFSGAYLLISAVVGFSVTTAFK